MTFAQVVFFVLAIVAALSAVMVILQRNPVNSALYLILNFFCLGGLYLTLNAQFIAMVQVLVYAGAIMVLFVFVIMLLNLGDDRRLREHLGVRTYFGIGFSIALGTGTPLYFCFSLGEYDGSTIGQFRGDWDRRIHRQSSLYEIRLSV